ncbi:MULTISPECIES: ferredoxin [Streptomyces]|uniref:Ferredoxin n=1 Tax=Streptomyces achromogenes TaxID=67255 RepID=A0ABU0PTH8_STRAH|nr:MULTISPECIES: ferredoxin [Streptomyces]MDQ0681251.1 ferredoxin [Streptomyces achromogenes]MDQ0828399.1 ferredoxin [Streptomyces achromogenes]MDQ0956554.1 ferredoxin [Streptomyces sp. B4I13]
MSKPIGIRVDAEVCQGFSLCHAMAPEVYEIDEDTGFNGMGEFEVPERLRGPAARGAAACPERAIKLLSEEVER